MIRTRFAPSPTGFLHIGGVRTALFNWLYARRHGGRFVLRIDDTDRERNLDEALAPILHGFRWLGIEWDEGPEVGGDHGPYFQSQRRDRYTEAVDALLENGRAYLDYATAEELRAERDEAERAKRKFVYSRRFMAESEVDRRRHEAEGRQAVVRLKMPRQGSCVVDDEIRGRVEIDWAGEQDHVIRRADGSFLYNLATVVDDHEMAISHVIRAEEHLSNTPRQIFIAEGLGWEPPRYAHLPFVAEPGSRNKLSKRKLDRYLKNPDFSKLNDHGSRIAGAIGHAVSSETFNPVIVDFYETVGYLPQALVNYLLLLGWSLDDKTEYFTREEMIDNFSLERVNKAAASFDANKLLAFQEHYMRQLAPDEILDRALPFVERAGYEADRDRLRSIVEAAGDRIKVAGDILDYTDFLVADDALEIDEQAFQKRLVKAEDAVPLLTEYRAVLAGCDAFDAASLESSMKRFCEERALKIGRIIHPVRVAVTGKAVGFGLFETLAILGRERVLARIDRAMGLVEQRRA